ncbi:MAG: tryptophan synthase subunit alpha [Tepidiformaceae bacterium]
MSQRLRTMFEEARGAGRAAFMPYVTAGYAERSDTVPILLAMQAGGADAIELGVPFTDPLADGATIQHANEVAVRNGVTFADCLGFVREARAQGLTAPVMLMGYYNPILSYGETRAVVDAAVAGADGFIVVDLPPEEAGVFMDACHANDLSFIPLVAPTTSDARVDLLAEAGDGFIYCVSVTGTTGERDSLPPELGEFIERVRTHTPLPLAVGFGISRRAHVEEVGRFADAAVIGSAIITAIDATGAGSAAERVREFVEDVTGRGRAGGNGLA